MPIALIATALPKETSAVTSHLDLLDEAEHPGGTLYPNGTLPGPGEWHVFVVQTGKGNNRAAIEVSRAIDFLDPRVALFVGVAGGVKDVAVGDVVVGDKVYYTEAGKATTVEQETEDDEDAEVVYLPRPEADRGDYRMLQLASSLDRSDEWRAAVRGDEYERAPLSGAKVEIGPIAAGEKVVAAKRSDAFKLVKRYYGDSVAVEMEGHGFGLAAYASGDTPGLVVRGISDLVDGKAEADNTGSQEAAAARAAAFAVSLLNRYRVAGETPSTTSQAVRRQTTGETGWRALREIASELYPFGPNQRSLWERAGGELAQLPQREDGRTTWFDALKLVRQGGGGVNLTMATLVTEMRADFQHPELEAFGI